MVVFRDWAFLSDIHMSDGSAGDDFSPREEVFNLALDYLIKEKIRNIKLGGDIFDLLETSSEAIRKEHFETLDRLFRIFTIDYVFGNHDVIGKAISVIEPYLGHYGNRGLFLCGESLELEMPEDIQGSKIACLYPSLLLHGHAVDPIISKNKLLAEIVAGIGGFFERHGFPTIDSWFSTWEKRIGQIGRHSLPSYDKAICDLAISKNYNSVFNGHSHNPVKAVKKKPDGFNLYDFNAGSWTNSEKGREPRMIIVRREGVQELVAGNKLEINDVEL